MRFVTSRQPSLNKTILIVDDEPDTAEMLGEMLRISGYNAIHACAGAQTLSLMLNHKPDGVILDVLLPDQSGIEVLKNIRRDPRLAQIPVILISGSNAPADVQQGMQAGASAYLTKPVSFWDVKETVDRCLQAAAHKGRLSLLSE